MAHDAPATVAELRDERLSAFMDGELPDREHVAVEIEIADDPTMRADLEGLQQVRDGLRDLEVVPAPRSFALTAPPVRPATWLGMPRLDLAMRTGAAVAAVAFAVVLVGDIGGTGSGPIVDRSTSAALSAAPVPLSLESSRGADAAAEPQATPLTAQAATDGESAPPAATPEPTVSEGTAALSVTEDGSGADDADKTVTTVPPDAGGQVSPSSDGDEVSSPGGGAAGSEAPLAAPNTGSTEAGSGDADPAPGDASTDRATPSPATDVEPAATSGDDDATTPAAADEATTSAATTDEPAASPQPVLASPVPQPESASPFVSPSDGGASAAAIALGALAVLFTATSLVLWRRRSVQL